MPLQRKRASAAGPGALDGDASLMGYESCGSSGSGGKVAPGDSGAARSAPVGGRRGRRPDSAT